MKTTATRRTAWATNTLHRLDIMCRYLLLNLLWVTSCALVVTAPAGTKAMLEVTQAWAAGVEAPVLRSFATQLRRGFVQTTTAALPVAAAGLLLVFNFEVASHTGDQRSFLIPALTALTIPYLVFALSMLPANIGHMETLRTSYARTVTYIVTNPAAAAKTILVLALAAFIIYIQPYAILVIAAPAARLIATPNARTNQPAT